jgi:hypothetical protein
MIATIINCAAVIAGSLLGLLLSRKIHDEYSSVIFQAAGVATLVIGFQMALQTGHPLYLVIALMLGGLVGTRIGLDQAIFSFGEALKRRFGRPETKEGYNFSLGFLEASVLFCVGAMTIVGSFEAGAFGNYNLILTKSVLDGFMAIIMTAARGPGVAFSALPILVYQGALTLGAVWIKDAMSPLMRAEISAVGGAMIIMIGLGLLKIKSMKTANFLPAMVFTVALVLLHPLIESLGIGI